MSPVLWTWIPLSKCPIPALTTMPQLPPIMAMATLGYHCLEADLSSLLDCGSMKLGPGLSQSPLCPQLHRELAGHNALTVYDGFTRLIIFNSNFISNLNLMPASSFSSPNSFLEEIIRANTYIQPLLTARHHKKKKHGSLAHIFPITSVHRFCPAFLYK